jgi:hypothetical protein
MSTFKKAALAGFAAAVLFALPAKADLLISNTSTGNIGSFGDFSAGSTPTYGETVTVVAGNTWLQSFTYSVQNSSANPLSVEAYVFAWNGSAVTGPALFTSSPLNIAADGSNYDPVTISGLNLNLTAGSQYYLAFSTIGLAGNVGGARFLTAADSSYTGGTFEYNNDNTLAGLAIGGDYNGNGNFGDLAFSAFFTSASATAQGVPEPLTLSLFGAGLVGAVALRRRRK